MRIFISRSYCRHPRRSGWECWVVCCFFVCTSLSCFFLLLLLLLSICISREKKKETDMIDRSTASQNKLWSSFLYSSFIDDTPYSWDMMSIFREKLRSIDHSFFFWKKSSFHTCFFPVHSSASNVLKHSFSFFSFLYIVEKKEKEGHWRQAITCCCFCSY
jgi:hypothetical protein